MYFKKWKDFVNEQAINQGTNSNIKTNILTNKQLQEYLNDWNSSYSQEFKFKNDMPKNVGNENTVDELLNNIADEYKIKVKEAINKMIDFFSNEKIIQSFNNKELLVIGYTSTTASNSYNDALSLRRAKIVANSIKNLIKNKKININIKFKEEGMGENPNSLIIVNDQSLEPVQLGKGVKLSPEIMNLVTNNKEERQKLNRRVKITLPEFIGVEPEIKISPKEEVKKEIPKPELPNPTDITFNFDSYILTKKGQNILSIFCDDLKNWNTQNKDNAFKTLYISSHTLRGKESNNPNKKRDEELRDNKLTILSANRAKIVEDFIKIKLGEDLAKNITFYSYPVAFTMGEEKKVVINFDKTNHMKTAEQEFNKLSEKYDLPKDDKGLNLPKYMENKIEKNSILYNIESNMKSNNIKKWIPLELFYDTLDNYYGLKRNTTERTNFKQEVIDSITKWNKKYNRDYTIEDFVYDPE